MPAHAVEAANTEPAAMEASVEAAAVDVAAMKEAASDAIPHREVVRVIWIVVAITRRQVVTGLIALTILIVIWVATINGSIGL